MHSLTKPKQLWPVLGLTTTLERMLRNLPNYITGWRSLWRKGKMWIVSHIPHSISLPIATSCPKINRNRTTRTHCNIWLILLGRRWKKLTKLNCYPIWASLSSVPPRSTTSPSFSSNLSWNLCRIPPINGCTSCWICSTRETLLHLTVLLMMLPTEMYKICWLYRKDWRRIRNPWSRRSDWWHSWNWHSTCQKITGLSHSSSYPKPVRSPSSMYSSWSWKPQPWNSYEYRSTSLLRKLPSCGWLPKCSAMRGLMSCWTSLLNGRLGLRMWRLLFIPIGRSRHDLWNY